MNECTFEGIWEEVALNAKRFAGKRVRVSIIPDDEAMPVPQRPLYETMNAGDWSAAFAEWAADHDRSAPLLSDEAMSRDTITQGVSRHPGDGRP